jgi:transcriptional regulator GlxA family with amidase domain
MELAETESPRRVAMLAYPDAQLLDITGPLQVFATATKLLDRSPRAGAHPYEVFVVAREEGPLRTCSGIEILARGIADIDPASIDTLLISGGVGSPAASRDPALLEWIRGAAPQARRAGSVCTGAFLLASAGLLDGRRATTHWALCAELARAFPSVKVEPDAIFVHDRGVWSSAGITAGMDLALAMVEVDLGRAAALEVARVHVMFLKRPGGQSQFSSHLAAQMAGEGPLADLIAWVVEHPGADLRAEALARRAKMSLRTFARAFSRELGTTPADFVERVRVEAARRWLEESDEPVEGVASRSGFGDPERMRRAFLRRLGVPPKSYRNRFRTSLSPLMETLQ